MADSTAPADDLRAAFIAGALWADDHCPVHSYPAIIRGEAEIRYPSTETEPDHG